MKKWAVVLYNVNICGGYNVIIEHMLYAHKQGVEIYWISNRHINPEEASWHPGTEEIRFTTFEECKDEVFDMVMATEWITAYDMHKVKAKKYLYFVQAVESQFQTNNLLADIAEFTYTMPFRYITEATWIQRYLKEKYNQDGQLCLNGIRKDLYLNDDTAYEAKEKGKLRVLVEGSLTDWRKNVQLTVELCRKSKADEIWLLTSTKVEHYDGVDRVYSQIPIQDVPKIYRSCDVLVKLSLVEGMFGPPLEMFHCGGTAITYDIDGHEEYEINGVNSIVVPKGSTVEVVEVINKLKCDTELLEKLKKGAEKTASEWRGWDVSSKEFYEKVESIPDSTPEQINEIQKQSRYLRDISNHLLDVCVSDRGSQIEAAAAFSKENNKEIVLYGAGRVAKKMINALDVYNVHIAGILVSSHDDNPEYVMGHKVYTPDEIYENRNDYVILIATTKYYNEIKNTLSEQGFINVF